MKNATVRLSHTRCTPMLPLGQPSETPKMSRHMRTKSLGELQCKAAKDDGPTRAPHFLSENRQKSGSADNLLIDGGSSSVGGGARSIKGLAMSQSTSMDLLNPDKSIRKLSFQVCWWHPFSFLNGRPECTMILRLTSTALFFFWCGFFLWKWQHRTKLLLINSRCSQQLVHIHEIVSVAMITKETHSMLFLSLPGSPQCFCSPFIYNSARSIVSMHSAFIITVPGNVSMQFRVLFLRLNMPCRFSKSAIIGEWFTDNCDSIFNASVNLTNIFYIRSLLLANGSKTCRSLL